MTVRPTQETLESLRLTLQKLEQTTDPASDGHDVIELKQILLNRIAELEALSALLPPNDEPKQEAGDLPPLAAVTETEQVKEPADAHPLEKLD